MGVLEYKISTDGFGKGIQLAALYLLKKSFDELVTSIAHAKEVSNEPVPVQEEGE